MLLTTLRKGRGNDWEYRIVTQLEYCGYHARRMGGSSVGLPDVVAANNTDKTLLAIEAKSSEGTHIYVPIDQVERCLRILEMFSIYENKYAILSFKFMSKVATDRTRKLTRLINEEKLAIKNSNKIHSKNSPALYQLKKLITARHHLAKREIKIYHYIINDKLKEIISSGKHSSFRCTYDGNLSLILAESQILIPIDDLETMIFNNHKIILPHLWVVQKTLM